MLFTEFHRVTGSPPGPFTAEMIDIAIRDHVAETEYLDWKRKLPDTHKNLRQTDLPKDIAAMANAGGGVLVYGIGEVSETGGTGGTAADFSPVVGFDDNYERSVRAIPWTAISPAVHGVTIHRIAHADGLCVIVTIPDSPEAPHFISDKERMCAPIRSGTGTVNLTESSIERLYRRRFELQDRRFDALAAVYAEAASTLANRTVATAIGIAVPSRGRRVRDRSTRSAITALIGRVPTPAYVQHHSSNPGGPRFPSVLTEVINGHPRTGLRRWRFSDSFGADERSAIHIREDGTIAMTFSVGQWPTQWADDPPGPNGVRLSSMETFSAELLLLAATVGLAWSIPEYDVIIGIEMFSTDPFTLFVEDPHDGLHDIGSVAAFTPIRSTVRVLPADTHAFHDQVWEIARDCANQAGRETPDTIVRPPEE